MKSLLVIFAIMISCVSWAGGPDIPWPSPTYGNSGGSSGDTDKSSGQQEGKDSGLQHVFSIYLERNHEANSEECPFYVIIEEVDANTGEVIHQRQALHCISGIRTVSYVQ